jgi:hypothetical protein
MSDQIEGFQITIKRGWVDSRPRLLEINNEYLQLEDKDLINDPYTKFNKQEIQDYRFGIKWIRGFELTVGREYLVFVRNSSVKIIKISFKTFYGINKNRLHDNYSKILDELWQCYFGDITNNILASFSSGENISINNVLISIDGITIRNNQYIIWENVRAQDYHTYFAIYSKDNPGKINAAYKYLDEWNTGVLYGVIRTILKDKGLLT